MNIFYAVTYIMKFDPTPLIPEYGHSINTAKFLWPVGGRINRVPLYATCGILEDVTI